MRTFKIKTNTRAEFVDVTDTVRRAAAEAGVVDGMCFVYVPHTTAGITINEGADPAVQADIISHLEKLVPHHAAWRHTEGNADAHVKATLVGSSVAIPIEAGQLALGTWQAVYFCEFDGPRSRSLHVKVIKG
jgi:secondary thiamine-phosphate synthase enzyme